MAKEIDVTKVRALMSDYDIQTDEVEACKSALEAAKAKQSDTVRKVFEATKRKSITHKGNNLTMRIRHKDKENPDFNTATYYFATSAEETLNLDDEE